MKRVRIINCSNQSYWYKDMIGRDFKLIYESPRDYFVKLKGDDIEKAIVKMDGDIFEESFIDKIKKIWK